MASRRKPDDFQALVELCVSVTTGEYESIFSNTMDQNSIEKSKAALNAGFNIDQPLNEDDPRFSTTNFRADEIDVEFSRIAKFPRQINLNWFRRLSLDEILAARNELFSIVLAFAEIENAEISKHRAKSPLSILVNLVARRQQKAEAAMLVIWLLLRSDKAFRNSASDLSKQAIEVLNRRGNGDA
jgi:hypothetical protein